MKRKISGLAAALTSLIILIGCVARVGQVAFEPQAGEHIGTIGIPTISPGSLIFNDPKNPALKFGLIGGLIHMGEMNGKATELFDNPRSYYAALLHRALFDDLEKVGYISEDIAVERRNPKDFIDNYDGLPGPPVDAVLDVVIVEGGYTNVTYPKNGGAQFGGFRPYFRVIAKLITPGSDKILYSETFMYGHHNRYIKAINLDAPPEYFFDDVDAMKADPGKVKKGLELAVNAIAGKIAEQLASGHAD